MAKYTKLEQALTSALNKAVTNEKKIYKCKCGAWHRKGSKCCKEDFKFIV